MFGKRLFIVPVAVDPFGVGMAFVESAVAGAAQLRMAWLFLYLAPR